MATERTVGTLALARRLTVPAQAAPRQYARRTRALLGGWLALALAIVVHALANDAWPGAGTVAEAMHGGLSGMNSDATLGWLLFVDAWMPQIRAGLAAGACLGLAGALLQTITQNPLASGELLGVSAGAQMGLIVALLVPGLAVLPMMLAGGVLAALLTFALAGGTRTTPLRLTLAGAANALALSALCMVALTLYTRAAVGVVQWSTGSLQQFGKRGADQALWLLLPAAVALLALLHPLGLARFGEAQASALGQRVGAVRVATILLAAALSAIAIALAGPVGFVGLAAPNLVRLMGVHRPAWLIPLSALWGGAMLIVTDAMARALVTFGALPVGVMSAVIGAPVLLLLLRYGLPASTAEMTAPMAAGHRASNRRPMAMIAALVVIALVAVTGLTLTMGVLSWPSAWQWRDVFDPHTAAGMLVDLRLPRSLIAMGAGALLAGSGVLLQGACRNPLAGPELLGVNQAAGLAVLALLLVSPDAAARWSMPAAWAASAGVLAIVLGVNARWGLAPMRVILTGMALAGLLAALANLLVLQFHVHATQALVWLVGSSYGQSWHGVRALLPWLAICLPLAVYAGRWLDLLSLGDETAEALGVPVVRARLGLLVLASAMAAAAVATVGPVAYVGLIVPNALRSLPLTGTRDRIVTAALAGALLLGVADLFGRTLFAPLDLPLGIVTAAVGTPLFLWLLSRTFLRSHAHAG
ncbi:pandorabactin ABC transporter permease subunit PanO [Pandoraea sputorum]